jgi:AcrR family transcriptional regulator
MPEALSDAAVSAALRPRERILLAARDLFHRHGIRGVGVETIAEAAGTNKMTLYRHFDSKDDLILAYLRGIAVEVDEMWRDIERDHPGDMQGQLKAWLVCAEECVTSDERGCDLANAAVELTDDDHPGRRIIEKLKSDHRDRLAELCRRAGISQPEVLADTLTLLLEGARVSRQAAGSNGPSSKFIRTAEKVIESFMSRSSAKQSSLKQAAAKAKLSGTRLAVTRSPATKLAGKRVAHKRA